MRPPATVPVRLGVYPWITAVINAVIQGRVGILKGRGLTGASRAALSLSSAAGISSTWREHIV
jgi:hypothetical protein